MFNREQYLNMECDHHTYFKQFATPAVIALVKSSIGIKRIKASTDLWMNDIPLGEWGNLHDIIGHYVGRKLGEANSSTYANGYKGYSLSDTVCVAKAAARILKETTDE